jgi:hypothetical protein
MKRAPRPVLLAVAAATGACCATTAAPARAGDDNVATAQILFEEGRRRMTKHDYEGACPKLAESQRLSPAVGTEFNLADCWEHIGKLASAWAAFLEVADLTHRRGEVEREQAARARVDALEPRVGRLTIDVPALRRVPDLEIHRDGERVRDTLWGVAVPVDAGDHHVEARAPGRKPWSATVHTTDGGTASITVPDLPPAPTPVPLTGTATPGSDAGAGAGTGTGTGGTTTGPAPGADHTAALIVLGGSVVLAGIGITGLVERESKVNDYNADPACPSIGSATRPAHCDDLVSASNTWMTVAVVGFVTSGLALAGGVTLWLTAPRPAAAGSSPAATSFHCAGGLASIACAGTF